MSGALDHALDRLRFDRAASSTPDPHIWADSGGVFDLRVEILRAEYVARTESGDAPSLGVTDA